jgi:hypothetical protein
VPHALERGALLGQQIAARGLSSVLLGITPEGVEIAANAAKAMGEVRCLGGVVYPDGLEPRTRRRGPESVPSKWTDFLPPGVVDKLAAAIPESRARVSQDIVLYRTQRPVRTLTAVSP